MPLTVTIVADYGPLSDMAFAEVTKNIYHQMEGLDFRLNEYSVPAFDTYQTGFLLAQVAINSKLGDQHYFFVNTAPRHDDDKPRKDSAGEKLVYMKLYNGVQIVAVNSGASLAFVKEAAVDIKVCQVANEGSQFRSRDFYPMVLGKIAQGDDSVLIDKTPDISDIRNDVVGFVDGYGNIKTTICPSEIDKYMGQFVGVEIGGVRHIAKVGESIFDVPDGYLCVAKGSSGWALEDGSRKQFVEIVRRSGNAFLDFKKPSGGAQVKFVSLS